MDDEFEVIYLKEAQSSVAKIYDKARQAGLEKMMVDAAQIIHEHLRTQPREFGDPFGTLVKLELDLFSRGVRPLMVYYGVHQKRRLVFVNKIRILPFSSL